MKMTNLLSRLLVLLLLAALLTAITIPAGANLKINNTRVFVKQGEEETIERNLDHVGSFYVGEDAALTIPQGVQVLLQGKEGVEFTLKPGAVIQLEGTLTRGETEQYTPSDLWGSTIHVYLNKGAELDPELLRMPDSPTPYVCCATVNYYGFSPSCDSNRGKVTAPRCVTKGEAFGAVALAKKGYEFVNWTDETGRVVSTNPVCDAGVPALTKDSELTANFARSLSGVTVEEIAPQICTGVPITPAVTVTDGETLLFPNRDYTLSYRNNIQPGQGLVILTGMGEYAGMCTACFAIEQEETPENIVADSLRLDTCPASAFGKTEKVCAEAETVSPEIEAVTPETEEISPETEAVPPETEAVSPEAEAANPETEAVTPEVGEISPETEAVTPEIEEVSPEAEVAAPETEPAADGEETIDETEMEIVENPISVLETEHGSLMPENPTAGEGDLVTVTVTPEEGYTMDTLTVLDETGAEIVWTAEEDGTVTFLMPAGAATVSAVFVAVNPESAS